jgi:hypothetical protein
MEKHWKVASGQGLLVQRLVGSLGLAAGGSPGRSEQREMREGKELDHNGARQQREMRERKDKEAMASLGKYFKV